ncbi:MAG: hypothetical protein KFH98_14595 [Gemmatimonadetes bacterium]|nr:hypothetical protein [Gemmatimonadota bacterium]
MEALIPISMFMCIAAVMILRPITKKLGGLLEAITIDRTQARMQDTTGERTVALLEHINRRMDLMEERIDFTERLVSARNPELRRTSQRSPLSKPELDVDFLTG